MKIIDCIVLGGVSSYTPSDYWYPSGTCPKIVKPLKFIYHGEGKGTDTLCKKYGTRGSYFTLKGKAENRLLYLNMGNYGGRVYFYSEPGEYQLKR